jgi:Retrotransposon gag protein
MWAMSYMKTGHAQKWTACIFRWEQLEKNVGQTKFLDWEDFRDKFRREFTPPHTNALAIKRLESSAYYQRNHCLNDYIDEFQDLIVDSGYTDPKTIVVKFRRGLNAQIQNVVATMAAGRPSDAKPEQWYHMARTVDQNQAADEAFSSSHRPSVPTPRPVVTSTFRSVLPVKTGHSHIQLTPGNPVPMDLDIGRKTAAIPAPLMLPLPTSRTLWQGLPHSVRRSGNDHRGTRRSPTTSTGTVRRSRHFCPSQSQSQSQSRQGFLSPQQTNCTPLLSSQNRFSVLHVDNIPKIDEFVETKVMPSPKTARPSRKPRPRWEKLHCSRFVINTLDETEDRRRSLTLKIELQTTDTGETKSVKALLDSGATGMFIDREYVKENWFDTQKLSRPILL